MNAARCHCLATRNPLVILAFCLPFKSLPSVRTDLLNSGLQVEFECPVDAKGNIETWLQRLVDGMQDTVKQVSINSSECMHACMHSGYDPVMLGRSHRCHWCWPLPPNL